MEEFVYSPWFVWVAVIAGIWTLPWTGVALWMSARDGRKGWFIALLLINSLAGLEILYIFVFRKRMDQNRTKAEDVVR